MRHVLRETFSGLKRNTSMVLAVIVTMWVSLTLFGIGLLAAEQVDLVKDRWYDRIEISIFLCVKDSTNSNCETGVDTSQADKDAIEAALRANPEVADVFYESKAEMWEEFKKLYADSPILAEMTVDQMQDSFRVKLVNPEEYMGVVTAVSGMKGVEKVQDLHQYLDPVFNWLNIARMGTLGLSALLLIAAALQIGNTVALAAFSRRREIGIMRLVGASNWYIMLPFLLESLLAALAGVVLACGSLAALEKFIIVDRAKEELPSINWIDWPQVQVSMFWLLVVGVVLSVIPTIIGTRRFLKV
ncbi:MAG: permease-like cell division protein FtsX [Propionibacteriaceae bacterium]|nr:permease-like cell division protein FtsX [Propionibacteriaceae bacterium]